MDKIKVLHFELSRNIGGIEMFLLNLMKHIDSEKVQFDFVTTAEVPALGKEIEKIGGRIYLVSKYKNIFKYSRDIKRILENGYDIVHIHKNSAANILPVFHAKGKGNIIVHSHNTAPSIGKFTMVLHKLNKKYMYKVSDTHIACSREAGIWMYGKENFIVVPNGIEISNFLYDAQLRNDKRKELRIPLDVFVVGNVGRFVRQKNHTYIVDIFAEILKSQKNAVLLLVGEGELKKSIEEKVKKMGLQENVRFLGKRTDIAELMCCMDCFLMPSLYEGFPITTIEAQACGLRVFLSNTIAKEAAITDLVDWIDIKKNPKKIASEIVKKVSVIQNENRLIYNGIVKSAGFDMQETAAYLENMYLEGK